jgi:hypothetical protein
MRNHPPSYPHGHRSPKPRMTATGKLPLLPHSAFGWRPTVCLRPFERNATASKAPAGECRSSARLGKEHFADVNEDGHADLVITQKFTFEDDDAKTREDIHLWQASEDHFENARRLTGDDCHCE